MNKIKHRKNTALTALSIVFVLLLAASISFAEEIPEKLIEKLVLGNEEESRAQIPKLLEYSTQSISEKIASFDGFPKARNEGELKKYYHKINDTLKAPYFVYEPTNYEPGVPVPLVVWLHGGVSRPEFFTEMEDREEDPEEYLRELHVMKVCQSEGWFCLMPLARMDCLWWNKTGMDFIDWLIRDLKRRYNIDDRVVMTGFSDGGSGSFHFAFLNSTDYAQFAPYSGMISVSSSVGGMQVYPINLTNRPVFSVNGGRDGLYPAHKLLPLMNHILEKTGGEFYHTVYDTAHHSHGYLAEEMGLFAQRIKQFPRRAFAPEIIWECDNVEYGRMDWIEITAIDAAEQPAEWRETINYKLTDDRVMIGFMADNTYEGNGIKVGSVVEDSSAVAVKAGMQKDDIVIRMDDIPTGSLRELAAAKRTKKRGDPISITALRGEEELVLTDTLPPLTKYDAFKYSNVSGVVKAYRSGNYFNVETSNVKDFSIYIHPEMVRLDQPVVVSVDGDTLFNDIVKPDKRLLLDTFIENRDRRLLWMGKIDFRL